VRSGWFPKALALSEVFDVITFQRRAGAPPDVRSALSACFAHLDQGGPLRINIPNICWPGVPARHRPSESRNTGSVWAIMGSGTSEPPAHYSPRSAPVASLRMPASVKDKYYHSPLSHPRVCGKGYICFRHPGIAWMCAFVAMSVLTPVLNAPSASDIAHLCRVTARRSPVPDALSSGSWRPPRYWRHFSSLRRLPRASAACR
jgi:hypothetical protein